MLELLKTLTGTGTFLFPHERNPKRCMSNGTINQARSTEWIRKQTGHGLRGIASTILHDLGNTEAHIEWQLAPAKRNAVAAAHNHF